MLSLYSVGFAPCFCALTYLETMLYNIREVYVENPYLDEQASFVCLFVFCLNPIYYIWPLTYSKCSY